MKIAIYGAGAIGGHIGALLAMQGVDVTLIARGDHLAAMKKDGLKLVDANGEHKVRPHCTDDPADAGPQDYVILTLKAPSVPAIAGQLAPMLTPGTTVVTATNGIPFWYFHTAGGRYEGRQLDSVDPGGVLWKTIGPERCLGCVVWSAGEIVAPGVVRHSYGNRMPLGEPDGTRSERAIQLSRVLIAAGLKSPVRPRIRNEIWMKLWGNLSFNPVSVLTHATLDKLSAAPESRPVIRTMMVEAQAVAEALGVEFPLDVDARIAAAEEVGAHKTSMLQDLERGRTLEIDALVKVVSEMGRLVEVPTPTIDLVLGLVIQRARETGCYPA
jgi:2-dehydropantoate 2-reductase